MNTSIGLLDETLEYYHIQPVGKGYIDCICPRESIDGFITRLSLLGIKIEGFTWWCFSDSKHPPCGMGGPKNKYGEGYFSEMQMQGVFDLESNEEYHNYLVNIFPYSKEYKDCLVPAFWLKI